MLSIIIVNYNSSKDISVCIESIIKHEPMYTDYEVIVVDNNSSDRDLPDLQNKYPFIKIINAPKNGGFAYGNNIGIRHSSFDTIFLLNPDTYIEDNSIEKLYRRLMSDPDVDLIGPLLLFPDKTNQSYYNPKSYLTLWKLFCEQLFLYRLFPKSRIFNSYYRTYMNYDNESIVEQISGAALMFKKNILSKTGLMDENYFMYHEESDFCYQAVKNGFKLLYYPQSIIFHVGGFTNLTNWHKDTFFVSLKYYFKKNFNTGSFLLAIIFFKIGRIVRKIQQIL